MRDQWFQCRERLFLLISNLPLTQMASTNVNNDVPLVNEVGLNDDGMHEQVMQNHQSASPQSQRGPARSTRQQVVGEDYEFLELPGTSRHPNRRCCNGAIVDVRIQPSWAMLEMSGDQPHETPKISKQKCNAFTMKMS